jgi:4'-phosphopantetheinyl transferase
VQPTGHRCWRPAPHELGLDDSEVHAWRVSLSLAAPEIGALRSRLSRDELARADAFQFEHHRDGFIAAHAALREILGRYLGAAPDRLELAYNAYGKPELPAASAGGIQFNLAHSGAWALVAVSRFRPVGIDLERVRPLRDIDQLARNTFSARELASYEALPQEGRQLGFFACWTRKEAMIKAWGVGLSIPLHAFDVSVEPGVPAKLLGTRLEACDAHAWRLEDLRPAAGYIGALAARGADWRLRLLCREDDIL